MRFAISLLLALVWVPAFSMVQAEPAAELALEVRAAETAFAQTMADRDLDAFVKFVAADAVFFANDRALRGAEAVKAAWSPFFQGARAPFAWKPEIVEVLDTGDLAFGSGPVLDPQGRVVGTFNSVWRRTAKGRWQVVFDKGCPPCDGSGRTVDEEKAP